MDPVKILLLYPYSVTEFMFVLTQGATSWTDKYRDYCLWKERGMLYWREDGQIHCLKTYGIQALSHSLNVTLWVVSVGPVLILYQNTKREKSTLTSKQTNEH